MTAKLFYPSVSQLPQESWSHPTPPATLSAWPGQGLPAGLAGTGREGSQMNPQSQGAAPTLLLWGLQQHQDLTQLWGLGGGSCSKGKYSYS